MSAVAVAGMVTLGAGPAWAEGDHQNKGQAASQYDQRSGQQASGQQEREGVLGMGGSESERQERVSADQLKSKDIREVQKKLNEEGFRAGSVDGQWGPQTQAAIKNFQQSKGLEATGRLDEKTLDELGVDIDSSGGIFDRGSSERQSRSGGEDAGRQNQSQTR
jgi:peptidoglycan hydrolase-like protein with peptidoglycan-binding domain